MVNVSSWGNDVVMNFNEMYKSLGFGGMIYFAEACAQSSVKVNPIAVSSPRIGLAAKAEVSGLKGEAEGSHRKRIGKLIVLLRNG